jgi:pimeloyl-ACP methyl ester carboxylesterase
MLDTLKKLQYGARVLLSRNGLLEMIDVHGRPTQVQHGGSGPPFVYLHSALGETLWLPFLDKWSRSFEVFAPAHPGFAKSQGLEQIDTVEDMVFHYLELFDALGMEKFNLGGVSLGGWIAVEFAIRWPERVNRLWLSGAPGLWLDDEPLFDIFRHGQDTQRLRQAMFHDPNGYQAQMIIREIGTLNDETLLSVYQSMTALARLVWERPYDPKLPQRLYRIQCPTLLVWGESDRLVPLAYGEAYQQLIPGSRLHIVRSCGHFPMFEQEAEFVDLISRFCS